MNRFYIPFSKVLLAFTAFIVSISVQAQDFPKIEIEQDSVIINSGEIYQLPLMAKYFSEAGSEATEVEIKWHTDPEYLGKIDKYGVLKAKHAGTGRLIAKYKNLRYYVSLVITGAHKDDDDDDDDDNDGDNHNRHDAEHEYPRLKVVPGSLKVTVGDSVELNAFYIDTLGVKTDTVCTWAIAPMELGGFQNPLESMFHSSALGKGIIVATLGDLSDTIKVRVVESKYKKNHGNNNNNGNNNNRQLTIEPGDTVVYSGSGPIQYSASYKTNGNKHQDAEMHWSVSNEDIATIDTDGMLTLSGETGMAIVSAKYSNFKACVELLVIDSMTDLNVNTIDIRRVLPNGNELKTKRFKEGDSYKIGGLPFPLNILNGGKLHFPFGCIDEDIVIYMFIPEDYTSYDEDSMEVVFNKEIITGVKFGVKPASSDTIIEPFYFNIPIELSMVFKHGLLSSLGVNPENLDVFFAENTGFIKDGTNNVVVDTVRNRIYASIEHFSTIVVRQKSIETVIHAFEKETENLLTVFPNPFNTSTQILYKVDENSEISLSIYNLFGQKVKELVNNEISTGTHTAIWDGTNESGNVSKNGIYFCRIVKNGKNTQVARIVLNR